MKKIVFAIPKGRILEELLPLFDKAKIKPEKDFFEESSRKLVFTTNLENLEIVKVRSFDVATFVKFGAADIGVCGKDVIEEFSSKEIFPLLDLSIGKCRLAIAAKNEKEANLENISHIRVATKYVEIARDFFAKKGIQLEAIKLNGSIEIASKLGLCDYIIDLVSSGKTLQENNMKEVTKLFDVSSYLIANRSSFKTKNSEIRKIIEVLQ